MHGLALRTIRNLMPAAGAVGHDDGIRLRAHGRQQAQLGHLHRHRVVAGLVAEAARHAAAGAFDHLRFGTRDQAQHVQDHVCRAKGFLVAMAVHQHRRVHGFEAGLEAAGLGFARDELLEQQRVLRHEFGLVAQTQHQSLVAQRQQAGRLQPDDGHAGFGQWVKDIDQGTQAFAGLIDHAAAEIGAAAAQVRALGAWRMQHIAGGAQHGRGGQRVLGFKVAVEGVHEEHRRAAVFAMCSDGGFTVRVVAGGCAAPEGVSPPAGQLA